jgi:hypothetical protein
MRMSFSTAVPGLVNTRMPICSRMRSATGAMENCAYNRYSPGLQTALWALARLVLSAESWQSLCNPRMVQCWAGGFLFNPQNYQPSQDRWPPIVARATADIDLDTRPQRGI